MKNKILINASILSGKNHGLEIYTINIINNLVPLLIKNNYEIDIYAFEKKYIPKINGYNYKKIKINSFIDYYLVKYKSIYRVIWNLIILKKLAKNYKIIYSPSTHGTINLKNQIITIHDLISLNYPLNNFIQYLYFKYIVPIIIKKSEIITISQYTKNQVIKYYKLNANKIVVIYNGKEHLLNNYHQNSNTPILKNYFLSVGLSLPHKNTLNLLKTIYHYNIKEVDFIIVSSKTNYVKKMIKMANKMNLFNVLFLHEVTKNDLINLYKNCLANLYLSLDEGFGFPPLEAALFNKISIISNTGALKEIYLNHAIQVNPKNLEEIYLAIKKIIEDKIDLNKYNLENLLEKYNWESTSKKIFNQIETNKTIFDDI